MMGLENVSAINQETNFNDHGKLSQYPQIN